MTPKIKRQKKVFLNQGKDNDDTSNFSRLEATAIAEIPTTVSHFHTNSIQTLINEIKLNYFQNELEDWNDDSGRMAGWEEIDDQNTKQIIRDTRKEMRAARQKQSVR